MVEVLSVVGHLHIVVRTEESAQHWVVQATVHINNVELIQHLMPCVATVQPYGVEGYRLPAPRIVEASKTFAPFSSVTDRMLPKLSVKAI